jgi:hypothetical protein
VEHVASDGDGDGYGYGDGYGDGDYLQAIAEAAGGQRATQLREQGAVIAVWRSRGDGCPSNGGTGAPAAVGDIQEVAGPLDICSPRALHATLQPGQWKGERWWAVALYPPVVGDHKKYGSLKREILADLGKCPY